jgi:hypothetical protein
LKQVPVDDPHLAWPHILFNQRRFGVQHVERTRRSEKI